MLNPCRPEDLISAYLKREANNRFSSIGVGSDHEKINGSGNWIDGLYLVADGLRGGGRARNNGRGWFSLDAGQTKHIADTHNRYIYFYAETRLQNKMYWGGENFHWFEGKRFGFFKADFGNDPEDFTQSFSCE